MNPKKKLSIEDFEKGLVLGGFLPPNTDKELEELEKLQLYNKAKKNTLGQSRKKPAKRSLSKSKLYFTRSVLAAKIVSELHNEPTFGHVKFQKLMYLCEFASEMDLSENYSKKAAGPYDRKLMHSIDSELKRQKWFDVRNEKGRYLYKPLGNSSAFNQYYVRSFATQKSKIQWLIDRFRRTNTERVELVATIHYCIKEIEKKHSELNQALLLEHFYSFHEAKGRFDKDRILRAFKWMKDQKMV